MADKNEEVHVFDERLADKLQQLGAIIAEAIYNLFDMHKVLEEIHVVDGYTNVELHCISLPPSPKHKNPVIE